jgi:NAD(P)-dependent dehydrogenase (short-subunit alcohol dehydrogenase family)
MERTMGHTTVLVTGTTSGLGYAAARLLSEDGWNEVFITGRSFARVRETAVRLATETKRDVFSPLELDLNKPSSVESALANLAERGRTFDLLVLNAGMVPGKERVLTAAGVEVAQAPLIGHHQFVIGLLRANLLSPSARIVIAGAEPARGGVPMFTYTDMPAFAAKNFRGDRVAAIEALIRGGPNVKYAPNRTYSDAKLITAWWTAALARRLPRGMAVYAVSPGAATATDVSRNGGPALKLLFIPIANIVPGMNQTPETAASRYLQAAKFGTDVSGQFFASAQGKFSGPIIAQPHPHLHDRASQEAAWEAVVKVASVGDEFPAIVNAAS